MIEITTAIVCAACGDRVATVPGTVLPLPATMAPPWGDAIEAHRRETGHALYRTQVYIERKEEKEVES